MTKMTDETNVTEIVIEEGDKHPFCPYKKPSCTRACSHWLNSELGCSSLLLQEPDGFELLAEYWEKIEAAEEAAEGL